MINFFPIPAEDDVRIVCPMCKVKQNAVIRFQNDNSSLPYIECCRPECGYLIIEETLEEVTRHVVRFPSDLRRIKTVSANEVSKP